MSCISPAKPDQRPHGIEALSRLCEDLLQRAIWAVEDGADRDRRFRSGLRSGAPALAMTARDVQTSFGADAVLARIEEESKVAQQRAMRACPFVLTQRDRDDRRTHQVLGWLRWLCSHRRHTRDARIVIGLTMGRPIGRIAKEHGLDRSTIKRRYRRAIDLIAAEKWQEILALS